MPRVRATYSKVMCFIDQGLHQGGVTLLSLYPIWVRVSVHENSRTTAKRAAMHTMARAVMRRSRPRCDSERRIGEAPHAHGRFPARQGFCAVCIMHDFVADAVRVRAVRDRPGDTPLTMSVCFFRPVVGLSLSHMSNAYPPPLQPHSPSRMRKRNTPISARLGRYPPCACWRSLFNRTGENLLPPASPTYLHKITWPYVEDRRVGPTLS
jgi:hypothetical protein